MYMSSGQRQDDRSCFWNEPQLLVMVRSKKTDFNYHTTKEDINSSLIRPSLKMEIIKNGPLYVKFMGSFMLSLSITHYSH